MAELRQPGPPVPPEPPEPPPDRLQRWFAAEVRAAERDVKRGLVSLPAMSMRRGALGRRGILGGAVAASAVAVLLVVALTSGFLGGTVGPSPTTGASGATGTPAAAGPSAVASPSGPLFADGIIPSTLEGQPVLRPSQAVARAESSTDASTFLVGGWVGTVYSYTGCATPSGSEGDQVLVRTFCGTYLNESPTGVTEGPLELHFRTSVSADWPGEGPVIVRVHTHDPLATSCSAANQDACAHAVVVDALLWNGVGPDGLPSWMDGQSTISVPEAQGMLAHFPDSPTELEVRGWYSGFALPCPYVPATVPPTPGSRLLPDDCQPSILGASPIPVGQDHATASDLNLTLGPGVDAPPVGAVVLEIHGHDPEVAACAPSIRAACDAAVIVDRVVWTASTGVANPVPTTTPVSSPVDVPSSIDGQPVLRGAAFVDRVNQATDASSFLVGGWTPVTPRSTSAPSSRRRRRACHSIPARRRYAAACGSWTRPATPRARSGAARHGSRSASPSSPRCPPGAPPS